MKIQEISLVVKYSEAGEKGGWKSLELSASANLENGEDPGEAEDRLYEHLTSKFRQLWRRNGVSSEHSQDVTRIDVQPSKTPEPPPLSIIVKSIRSILNGMKNPGNAGMPTKMMTNGAMRVEKRRHKRNHET